MTVGETRALVERFWATMNENDWRGAASLFADDHVLTWPQSRERLRGRENFVTFNETYPATGRWRFAVDRLIVEDGQAVSDVAVTDGEQRARVLSFITVGDGRITATTEYWPDPFEAPAWRAHLTERS